MGQSGQTDLITGLVYVLITVSVVGLVLNVGVPYVDKTKEISRIKENEKLMKEIDKIIATVASEGEGASRFLTVDIKEGVLDINGETETISISTKTSAEIMAKRYRTDRGNFFTGSELTVSLTSGTLGGESVWFLENKRIKTAIRKYDKNSVISLDKIIKRITFKPDNRAYKGRVDFYIDNFKNIDSNVITLAKKQGYNLPRGEIVAVVSNPKYDANIHIALEAGNDFLKFFVDGVKWK